MIAKKMAPRKADSAVAMLSTIHELDGSEEGFVSESYHRPEDVVYVGSDDEYYESSAQRTERCRAKFEAYLQRGNQEPPLIMSASLKGPFESKSWENPWRSRSQRTATADVTKQTKAKAKSHLPRQHSSTTKRHAMSAADLACPDTPMDINPASVDKRRIKQIGLTASQLPSVRRISESTAKEHAPTLLPVADTDGLPNPFNPKKRLKQSAADWLRRPGPVKKRKPGLTQHHELPPSSPSEQVVTKRKRTSDSRPSLPVVTETASDVVPRSSYIQQRGNRRLSVSSGIVIDESTMPDESSFIGATLTPFQDPASPGASSNTGREVATLGREDCAAVHVIGMLSSTHKRKKAYSNGPSYPSPDAPATYSSSPLSSIDSSKIFETQQDESFCFKAKVRQADKAGNKGGKSVAQTPTAEIRPGHQGSMDDENEENEPAIQGSGKSLIQKRVHDVIPELGNAEGLGNECGSDHVVDDDDGVGDDETLAVQDAPLHFSSIKARLTAQGHRIAEPIGNESPIPLNALRSQLKSKCTSRSDTDFAAGNHLVNLQQNSLRGSNRPSAIAETNINQEGESATKFEADETTLVQGSFSGVPGLYSQLQINREGAEVSPAGSQDHLRLKKPGEDISQHPSSARGALGSPSTNSKSVSLDGSRVVRIAKSGPVSSSQPLTVFPARSEHAVSSTSTRRPASQPLQNDVSLPLSSLRAIAQSSLNMYIGAVWDPEVTTLSLPDQVLSRQIVEETKPEALMPEGLPKSPIRSTRCTSSPSRELSINDGSTDGSEDDSEINAEEQPIHDATEIREPTKRVRWAPLPGLGDSAEEGDGPVVATLSPSASEENESESDSGSSDDAAGDDEDEDYIEAGLSRSARSRNVTRAKNTAAAVLASSVKPPPVPTRPHSPPPPARTFVDDLPIEVTLFQNHFAKVDSERNIFKPKTLKRPLAEDADLVQQFSGDGSQPVDAVARRFAEADAASVRAAAKKPRSSILSKPTSSPRLLEQNEENEQPVDDVSAVIDNLGDFLGGWDVDVELTQSAREREQNEAQSIYVNSNTGVSPWA
ncbi:hypothetical protein ACKVV7_000426 [Pyricularia oryzae]